MAGHGDTSAPQTVIPALTAPLCSTERAPATTAPIALFCARSLSQQLRRRHHFLQSPSPLRRSESLSTMEGDMQQRHLPVQIPEGLVTKRIPKAGKDGKPTKISSPITSTARAPYQPKGPVQTHGPCGMRPIWADRTRPVDPRNRRRPALITPESVASLPSVSPAMGAQCGSALIVMPLWLSPMRPASSTWPITMRPGTNTLTMPKRPPRSLGFRWWWCMPRNSTSSRQADRSTISAAPPPETWLRD